MLIYNLAYVYVLILGIISYHFLKDNKKFKYFYLISSGIILTLISGFRYGMGFDFFTFKRDFVSFSNMNMSEILAHRYEIGFKLYLKLMTMITSNPTMLYIVSSAIMIICAFYVINKYSKIPYLSILLYMSVDFYASGMNLIRYTMAAMIFFLSTGLLRNSKFDYSKENRNKKVILKDLWQGFLPYLLIVLLASSFHKSALIMIPFYFVAKIPLNKITGAIYALMTLSVTLFARPVGQYVSNKFFNGNYDLYDKTDRYSQPGGEFHLLFPLAFFLISIIFAKELIKKDKRNTLYINATIYNLALYIVAAFAIFIFTRVTMYFEVFVMLSVPEIISTFEIHSESELIAERKKEKRKPWKYKIKEKVVTNSCLVASALVLIFSVEFSNRSQGSHRIYPYMSEFQSVNKFNHLFLDGNRDKKEKYIKSQVNVGQYIKSTYDDKYIVIVSSTGEAFSERFYYFAAQPFEDYGIDIKPLLNQNELGFAAILTPKKVYLDKRSEEVIEETVQVGDLEIKVVAGSANNNYPSFININGTNYSQNIEGLNFVVYDTERKEVVDSVCFDTYSGTQFYEPEQRYVKPKKKIKNKSKAKNIIDLRKGDNVCLTIKKIYETSL